MINHNLPEDFDWEVYKSLNDDLKDFNKEEIINHYINYGFFEKREYKITNLNNKNVVLITSKINVSNNIFSYIKIRSIYTLEERFNQTFQTIMSIKKYMPNPYIILFDNSTFTNEEYKFLKNNVDKFINITDDKLLNFYTNECEYKAFADIYQQLTFYDNFFKFIDLKSVNSFYKISGRYLINSNFDYKQFDNKDIIFKKNNNIKNKEYYYTCFYKLNSNLIPTYFKTLNVILETKKIYENEYSDLEVILPKFFKDRMKLVDNLGITQIISVYNFIEDI
jgi:hypothetical protein